MPTSNMKNIPINAIETGERFRKDYGEMDDLIESIKEKGIIQPITVTPDSTKSGGFRLVAGGRRLQAAREAGLTEIPAIVREISDEQDFREIELFENIFRKDMDWKERIRLVDAIQRLHEEKNADTPWKWSQRKCAKMLGVSRSQLNNQINLARALDKIPGLAECQNESEALKKLRQLHNRMATHLAIKEQEERFGPTETEEGTLSENESLAPPPKPITDDKWNLTELLQIAKANYRIGDAIEGMEEIAGKIHGITFIEIDPPYGIDLQDIVRTQADRKMDIYNEIPSEEYPQFLKKITRLAYDCAYDDAFMAFWFSPYWYTEVQQAILAAGWKLDSVPAIWAKPYGGTNAPSQQLARCYETFFIARKGQAVLQSPGRSNIFAYDPMPTSKKYHPTQRPLELMKDILLTLAVPGTTVLVPFLGSGTTLRACYDLPKKQFRCFGWDLTAEYKEGFMLAVEEEARARHILESMNPTGEASEASEASEPITEDEE